MNFSRAEKVFRLTPRQSEVARRVGAGIARKQIADEMKISIRTVDGFLEKIRLKCAAKSTFELVYIFSHYLPRRGSR